MEGLEEQNLSRAEPYHPKSLIKILIVSSYRSREQWELAEIRSTSKGDRCSSCQWNSQVVVMEPRSFAEMAQVQAARSGRLLF